MRYPSFNIRILTAALMLASAMSAAFAEEKNDLLSSATCPDQPSLKSGWYLGMQGGYDSYRVRNNVNVATYSTPGSGVTTDPTVPGSTLLFSLVTNPVLNANGWVGGMLLGYGRTFYQWYYLGAEIFANYGNAEAYFSSTTASTYTNKFRVSSSYGIGLLPGLRFTDATMSYLRLGWNGANFKTRETVTGITKVDKKNTSHGFVFGVGIETLTGGDWSLRGEFDHTWYSSYTTSAPYSAVVKPSDNQFLASMIYHFA